MAIQYQMYMFLFLYWKFIIFIVVILTSNAVEKLCCLTFLFFFILYSNVSILLVQFFGILLKYSAIRLQHLNNECLSLSIFKKFHYIYFSFLVIFILISSSIKGNSAAFVFVNARLRTIETTSAGEVELVARVRARPNHRKNPLMRTSPCRVTNQSCITKL